MIKRIHKYPIAIDDDAYAKMPLGAEVLTAQIQHGRLCVWALVDTERQLSRRTFRIVGTGYPIPDWEALRYIATAQDGHFVWHVFEVQQ